MSSAREHRRPKNGFSPGNHIDKTDRFHCFFDYNGFKVKEEITNSVMIEKANKYEKCLFV